jgi:hypothetical protein
MLVQSHQSFDTVADYDPATQTFFAFSRRAEPARLSEPITGAYEILGGKRIVLYRRRNALYLDVDHRTIPLNEHSVDVLSAKSYRLLRISRGGNVVLELKYPAPVLDPPVAEDPTPFVQEEDFDFGLFLRNVSRDTARQSRMYAEKEREKEM